MMVTVIERLDDEVELERQRRLDLFAAAALTGILAACRVDVEEAAIAKAAWQLALAMLNNEPKKP